MRTDRTLQTAVLAVSLLFGLSSPAQAQTVQVVTNCAGVAAAAQYAGRLFTDQNGRLCAVVNTVEQIAGVNRSGTVGLTATTLMATNTVRRGWKIKNDCANAVWINFDGTAGTTPGAGNIKIAPGGYMASEPTYVETGAISAISELGACNLTAREY